MKNYFTPYFNGFNYFFGSNFGDYGCGNKSRMRLEKKNVN
jgi:hypothetical protein